MTVHDTAICVKPLQSFTLLMDPKRGGCDSWFGSHQSRRLHEQQRGRSTTCVEENCPLYRARNKANI
jgi:hypothetical protein